MRTVLATLALSALAVVTGAALVLYSGIIDVGADDPHSAPLHAVLETARERAVAVRAGTSRCRRWARRNRCAPARATTRRCASVVTWRRASRQPS